MTESKPTGNNWREAARDVMYQATIEEAERRFGTTDPVFNYRWEHVLAVHTLALKLAQLTGADLDVIEAAVWLHDVAKEEGESHAQAGAAFAREFLSQTDFPPEKIAAVAQAIEDHMGLWRDEPLEALESQVLWDADKLAKLGLTAACHWVGMGFAYGRQTTSEGLIEKGREADWQRKTVESMHTAAARTAALQRLHDFNQFWDTLEAELAGDDLEGA